MRKTLLILCLGIFLISCEKKNESEELEGIVVAFVLDGCDKLIQLDNGKRLEVVSLPEGIELQTGKRLAIRYKEKAAPSICMAGTTVEITSLRYL